MRQDASHMQSLCKAVLALGLLLGAIAIAKAQSPTLPPNTVLGRSGISAGPAQAIPFATFGPLLAPFLPGSSTSVPQSWTAAQRGTPVNIPIATATFTPNFDAANNFEIDLSSACPCTLANPSTTLIAGQSGIIEIHQDGSGSRTIGTYGTAYQASGSTGSITLSTAASVIDYMPYYVNNAATGIVLGALTKAPVH